MRHTLSVLAIFGFVTGSCGIATAADLETMPPPTAEAEPIVPAPPVAVEPPCPVVWRCGYWGCGWRPLCGPVLGGGYYGPPAWHSYGWRERYGHPYWGYRPYAGYGRHWGYYGQRWGGHGGS